MAPEFGVTELPISNDNITRSDEMENNDIEDGEILEDESNSNEQTFQNKDEPPKTELRDVKFETPNNFEKYFHKEHKNHHHDSRNRGSRRERFSDLHKKRKRIDGDDKYFGKKSKCEEGDDETDEDMIFMLGGSLKDTDRNNKHSKKPILPDPPDDIVDPVMYNEGENEDPRPYSKRSPSGRRDSMRDRGAGRAVNVNLLRRRGRGGAILRKDRPRDGPDPFFLQGKNQRSNDCSFAHAFNQPRKLEVCKFYLKDVCNKRDKCIYMHDDFPCQHFHAPNSTCYAGKHCKFYHGKLDEVQRAVVKKYADIPLKEADELQQRYYRESHADNSYQSRKEKKETNLRIPSLFDIKVSVPPEFRGAEGILNEDDDTIEGEGQTPIPSPQSTMYDAPELEEEVPAFAKNHKHNILSEHNDHSKDHNDHDDHHHHRRHHHHHHHHRRESSSERIAASVTRFDDVTDLAVGDMPAMHHSSHKKKSKKSDDHSDAEKSEKPKKHKKRSKKEDRKSDKEKKKKKEHKRSKHKEHVVSEFSDCDESFSRLEYAEKEDLCETTAEERCYTKFDQKEPTDALSHLPKKQQELFLRIQQHQKEAETSQSTNIEDEIEAEDSKPDENWYSSDEEPELTQETISPLATLLRTIKTSTSTIPNIEKTAFATSAPVESFISTRCVRTPPHDSESISMVDATQLANINLSEDITKILTSIINTDASNSAHLPVPQCPPVDVSRKNDSEKRSPNRISRVDYVTNKSTKLLIDEDLRFPHVNLMNSSLFSSTDCAVSPKDIDLRQLPFKPIPVHDAANEIDASITSHPPLEYKLRPLPFIPKVNYAALPDSAKLCLNDPRFKRKISSASSATNSGESPDSTHLPSAFNPSDPRILAASKSTNEATRADPRLVDPRLRPDPRFVDGKTTVPPTMKCDMRLTTDPRLDKEQPLTPSLIRPPEFRDPRLSSRPKFPDVNPFAVGMPPNMLPLPVPVKDSIPPPRKEDPRLRFRAAQNS